MRRIRIGTFVASAEAGRADRVVLVALNKAVGPADAGFAIDHGVDLRRAEVYRITAVGSPVRGADIAFPSRNAFADTLPPRSVTTYVLTP